MTIAELIRELQKYDPTILVAIRPICDEEGVGVELISVLEEVRLSCHQPWPNKDYFSLAGKSEQETGDDTAAAILLF